MELMAIFNAVLAQSTASEISHTIARKFPIPDS